MAFDRPGFAWYYLIPDTDGAELEWMHNSILRRKAVESAVGLSRSTIYAMIAEGTFPKPVKLGKRAVGWRSSDISAWLESREASAA